MTCPGERPVTKTGLRGERGMRGNRFFLLASVLALVVALAAPATAGGASTDQVTDVETALIVSSDDGIYALADCKFVKRVEKPDGSAKETQKCEVTGLFNLADDTPFVGELQHAYHETFGECSWVSDYWIATVGGALADLVVADGGQSTVTPSGKVTVKSTYPADPIDPVDDCGFGSE